MASFTLPDLCRSSIIGNFRHFPTDYLMLSLPRREVVTLLCLLSPLDLVQLENNLESIATRHELTQSDMNKIWSCVYKRCWDVESNVSSDQSNWRGYFLETVTHWLLNKLTLIHSCTSKDCRGSKFDYVLRVLFGCGSPFENSSATSSATSRLYGLHVICGHCKLVIPNYRRNEYDILIDLLEEERLVRLAQIIIDEFMYRPQSIKIILGRSHLSRLYSKFNQYHINRLGAFLCEVEHATFKHATETSNPVVSKIVQCICSREHKTKKVKMTLVNSNHNSDSWNVTLQNFTQDVILEIVCI
ncbi:PREDICTED: uncharacterized protein LOC109584427 [Amphimedon queenslandica]|uniref:Uncharacterized protein n=1 Tax=Amphimedon queenslandica TaxID=400682 RepID=A0AAN0JFC1_AMPQE|nr:PREDICTED: uncharacterized protein LOC109584427 [Amphimedon queenslandica]|eukprot:XP_019855735.1 PREDICTED: uncharacterized protein LOC109584427 [Amphimedon queenslandica]